MKEMNINCKTNDINESENCFCNGFVALFNGLHVFVGAMYFKSYL